MSQAVGHVSRLVGDVSLDGDKGNPIVVCTPLFDFSFGFQELGFFKKK
jgi:hypothetical protein